LRGSTRKGERIVTAYLVTGGAGFIGSHIAEALARDGKKVRILDNFSTGKRENLSPLEGRCEVLEGDITDRKKVDQAVTGVEYVFHQAALTSVPRSVEDPVSANEVNITGTLNLLEAARRHRVKRFVYASSSSVYGDTEILPKVEKMPTDPRSPYAVSKLAGELYCCVFAALYGMSTVSLRYFNVFGPRQDPFSQYSAVIPIFVKALAEGKQPTIFGDGEQSRDFTYVENVVNANILACHGEIPGGKVYNVACGERLTLNSLFSKLRAIMKVNLEPVYAAPRPGDVKHSQAGLQAIEQDLGYRTEVDVDEGLRRTVDWYLKGL
jgi:nucleoside-diphosphate-sugar epimerase